MSNTINTNYQSPLTPQAQAATNSDSSNSMSLTSLGSTFLNLLTQELKNQDPTAPMDATAMVGQMISLNQLDQLISINQTLDGLTGQPQSVSSSAKAAASQTQSTTGLPFDPNTLMPVATTTANPANPGDAVSLGNAVSMGVSKTSSR